MSVPSGWLVNGDGAVSHFQEVKEDEDGEVDEYSQCGLKRKRIETEMVGMKICVSKKGRKRVEDRVCSNCGTRSTPFWRKDKHSGKPLCNACGLYFSKNDVPRPLSLWRNAGGPGDA